MTGGLRKRVAPYVKIPSSTIRDQRVSYRARGILAYLLDMPDGWDVRSDAVAGAATSERGEGREAVRTALHELASVGYYRIERRQLRTGKFAMGTAVSEEPIAEWAAEYAEFEGKPVPMVEQEDATFLVRHKDGTLTDDGFPGAGSSGTGLPASGSPDSGSPVAISSTDTQDRDASSSLRSDATSALQVDDAEPADRLSRGWWDFYQAEFGPIVRKGKSNPFMALRGMVQSALTAGFTEHEIKVALRGPTDRTPDAVPAAGIWQKRLTEAHKGITNGGRPSNRHVAPDTSETAETHNIRRAAWNGTNA